MRLAVFSRRLPPRRCRSRLGRRDPDGLPTLVDDNLVRQETQPDGEPGTRCSRPSATPALERLEGSGEADELRRRHAAHFAASTSGDSSTFASASPTGFALERDLDNFRAALNELIACDDRASLVRLRARPPLPLVGPRIPQRGRTSVRRGGELAAELSPLLRARAWECAASFACWQHADDRSDDLFRRALATYRDVGDEAAAAFCFHELGWLAAGRGDLDEAAALTRAGDGDLSPPRQHGSSSRSRSTTTGSSSCNVGTTPARRSCSREAWRYLANSTPSCGSATRSSTSASWR